MYFLVRFFLFLLPAETAHNLTLYILSIMIKFKPLKVLISKIYHFESDKLHIKKIGLNFKNGIGLAAGMDKDAKYIDLFIALGFGFIEVGSVTPNPQSGNKKPRLFRLYKDKAIINRLGLNSSGVEKVIVNLKKIKNKKGVIIGANISKNTNTPNKDAALDYKNCFKKLYDYVDYFAINVSSPNMYNLRNLQSKNDLDNILGELQSENKKQKTKKPILLKISPDLEDKEIKDIVNVVIKNNIDGIIATNTTIDRKYLKTKKSKIKYIGKGGLSGYPIKDKSNHVIKKINEFSKNNIHVIGLGGIMNGENAIDKINKGSDLIQIYTGLIYRGPKIILDIKKKLINYME